MARWDTAGDIVNDAASEVGLTPVTDPFASSDPAFVQICRLLTTSCRELIGIHQWQKFIGDHEIVTNAAIDDGQYDLPADFLYMIDQTGWSSSQNLPLTGPLTAQEWTYIVNSGLGPQTLYITFREREGQFWILPNDPVPDAVTISFEYVRNTFCQPVGITDPASFTNRVTDTDDTILFPPILIVKLLKLRFLEAKGFDTTTALGQYNTALATWVPKDKSAPVLNMSRVTRTFPYLDYRNVPDTNYGS
jgi:hypothetical protein